MIEEGRVLSAAEMTDRMAELDAGGWPWLSDDDLLQLVASVQRIDVRDAAWAAMTRATASSHADLWRQAATVVDGPYALPVLALLAMAGWISGNGALSNVALDRASTIDGLRGLHPARTGPGPPQPGPPPEHVDSAPAPPPRRGDERLMDTPSPPFTLHCGAGVADVLRHADQMIKTARLAVGGQCGQPGR